MSISRGYFLGSLFPKPCTSEGSHNTVANAISRLDFGPVQVENGYMDEVHEVLVPIPHAAPTKESKHIHQHQMGMVFTNCSKVDVIYMFTVKKIAQAQEDDSVLKKLSKTESIPLN
jgi:hypothetical protein